LLGVLGFVLLLAGVPWAKGAARLGQALERQARHVGNVEAGEIHRQGLGRRRLPWQVGQSLLCMYCARASS
jgi:hypothetical protein